MIFEEIEKCIVKYFNQSADITDLDALNDWIGIEENQKIFKDYVKTHFAINLAMNDPNLNTTREKLLKEIRKEKNPFYRNRLSIYKYSAIAIVFLALGYLFNTNSSTDDLNKPIIPRKDAITLQLDNGDIKIINEDGSSQLLNTSGKLLGKQEGKKIVYDKDNEESKLVFNTISIPNGKKFNIVLSDGTKVYLNSGSKLTYPVKFLKNSIRKVSLTGEAFFEVAHDEKNKFIVNTEQLDVQVYGTKFNVSNYPENENTDVVLVQGSVSMGESIENKTTKEKEFFLSPGYKGTFNKAKKDITNEKVNTGLYTSWMDGNIIFRNTPFKEITRKLERSYNVIIINNNNELDKETFNATIETNYETIEQVLNYFNKVYKINYSIVENKIIIN